MGVALRDHSLTTNGSDIAYESGAFPELTVEAEIYPAARLTRSYLAHVGLGLRYSIDLPFSGQTVGEPAVGQSTMNDTEADTSSQRLLLDLRARWRKTDGSWSPTVTGVFGWGFRHFEPTDSDAYPRFDYQFLYLGAHGSLPLGTPLVAFEVGADFRPVLKAGQRAVNALGEREGVALGWSVRGGFSGRLPFGMTYFVLAEYLDIRSDFSGRTERSTEQRTPLRLTGPSSSSDHYIRAWAGLGYAY
jgi:hypothetical protein